MKIDPLVKAVFKKMKTKAAIAHAVGVEWDTVNGWIKKGRRPSRHVRPKLEKIANG